MYGLLGKQLSHSFSKQIHEHFTDHNYNLFETADLEEFFAKTTFSALNVTIPYKHEVIQHLDWLDPVAEALQAVNTIVRHGGQLRGYNTDYYGLDKALHYNDISVRNKHVIILGNGSTSRTIQYYCEQNSAKKITVLARNPKNHEHHFSDVDNFSSATIMFNATPVGMFPDNEGMLPIGLDRLPHLKSVVDVIYNPLSSSLLVAAKSNDIKVVNGLMMLIFQAVKSMELFHKTLISDDAALQYYQDLRKTMTNIIFIGMPMSGKTFYASKIADRYRKVFVDLDDQIEEAAQMSIPDLFASLGESGFRTLESSVVKKVSKRHNLAISCGGGVVLNNHNIQRLKQNGVIVFLDAPLEFLKQINPKDRPLLKDKDNLVLLYEQRHHLYEAAADLVVPKTNFNETAILRDIEVKLDEYFSS